MNREALSPNPALLPTDDRAGTRYVLCRRGAAVEGFAGALAATAGAEVRSRALDSTGDWLRALVAPGVVFGVLERGAQAWQIAGDSPTPIVAVPAGFRRTAIDRVLVPLDGTVEVAAAVARTVRMFRSAGVEVQVLHVFDRRTVPAYWDQAAHERSAWQDEFLSRYCTPYFDGGGPPLMLRSGVPAESVLEIAGREADLVILGWSQQLLHGHAKIIRRAMTDLAVPVMLIPSALT
ncbi:universal stress protein [Nocardia sp. NPDC046473]|uniref:universal stress protein n=1 Tax=Nocardia sp. NPDC046473 TaxID=3155733 RepID=UPI0033CDC6E9